MKPGFFQEEWLWKLRSFISEVFYLQLFCQCPSSSPVARPVAGGLSSHNAEILPVHLKTPGPCTMRTRDVSSQSQELPSGIHGASAKLRPLGQSARPTSTRPARPAAGSFIYNVITTTNRTCHSVSVSSLVAARANAIVVPRQCPCSRVRSRRGHRPPRVRGRWLWQRHRLRRRGLWPRYLLDLWFHGWLLVQ